MIRLKDLDIVYFYKEFVNHEELRYSLRSLEKNFPHNKIYIVGEGKQPDDITNITWIDAKMQDGYKYDKEIDKYRQVAMDDQFTEDVIFFHDDYFILQPTTHLDYYHKGTLSYMLERMNEFYGKGYAYYIWLEQAMHALEEHGLSTYNCELHCPIILNRKKLLKILDEFPGIYCTRTLYCNYYNLPLVEMPDNKSCVFYQKINPDGWIISTDDETFDGPVGEFIRAQFPGPSSFEMIK